MAGVGHVRSAASSSLAAPHHCFEAGQTIGGPSGTPHAVLPPGPHVIVRVRRLPDRETQERVRNTVGGRERMVSEGQIKLSGAQLSEQWLLVDLVTCWQRSPLID